MKFAGKKDHRWQVSNYIKRFIPIFNEKNLCTPQLYKVKSGENLVVSTFYHKKIEKGGDSIKSGGRVPPAFGVRRGRKQCTSHSGRHWLRTPTRITSPTSTWRTIMTDCLWLIWKQRRIRWNSNTQRTGASCVTTHVRPSSSQRSSISKTDQKGSEHIKRSRRLPRKRVDTTTDIRGKPPGKTLNYKQLIEPRQLKTNLNKHSRDHQRKQKQRHLRAIYFLVDWHDNFTTQERSRYNWERLANHLVTRATSNYRTSPTRMTP